MTLKVNILLFHITVYINGHEINIERNCNSIYSIYIINKYLHYRMAQPTQQQSRTPRIDILQTGTTSKKRGRDSKHPSDSSRPRERHQPKDNSTGDTTADSMGPLPCQWHHHHPLPEDCFPFVCPTQLKTLTRRHLLILYYKCFLWFFSVLLFYVIKM